MIIYFEDKDQNVVSLSISGPLTGIDVEETIKAYVDEGFIVIEDHEEAVKRIAKAHEEIEQVKVQADKDLEALEEDSVENLSEEMQTHLKEEYVEEIRKSIGRTFDAMFEKREKLVAAGNNTTTANILVDFPEDFPTKFTEKELTSERNFFIDEILRKSGSILASVGATTSDST